MLVDAPLRGVRDRTLALRTLSSLAHLDETALLALAESSKYRRFDAGEVLQREGEGVRHVQIVLQGRVDVTRHGKHLATVNRSGGVGYLSTQANDTQGVTAVAEDQTVVLEVPSDALIRAYEDNYSLLRNSIRALARNILSKR
jgi:CRP-like cAMP-binding protein